MYVLLDTATSGSIIFQFGHHGRFLHQKLFVFQVFEWDNDVRNIPKLTGTIFQARVLKIRANVGDLPFLSGISNRHRMEDELLLFGNDEVGDSWTSTCPLSSPWQVMRFVESLG